MNQIFFYVVILDSNLFGTLLADFLDTQEEGDNQAVNFSEIAQKYNSSK